MRHSHRSTQAGALSHPTLAPAHIILGIKEPLLNDLTVAPLPSPTLDYSSHNHNHKPSTPSLVPRTYLMFSHTLKGQAYNMGLLSRFLSDDNSQGDAGELLPRLIDYELITGTDGKRTIGFGWFAGGQSLHDPISITRDACVHDSRWRSRKPLCVSSSSPHTRHRVAVPRVCFLPSFIVVS